MADAKNVEMVEVDPKLFITCRLCLEDMGHFQIVPSVKYQIKFCFDISVEPFDGLPQLLCRKCKSILCEYSKMKTKFNEKQESLKETVRAKKNNNISPTQNTWPLEDPIEDNKTEELTEKVLSPLKISRKRINRILPAVTSSSDSENSQNISNKVKRSGPRTVLEWKKYYIKKYCCNLCTKSYIIKQKLSRHLATHSRLKYKYQNVVDFNCSVRLDKIDKKLNETGLNSTVMLNNDRIIENMENRSFHILYLVKDREKSTMLDNGGDISQKEVTSESSDDEGEFIPRKKRKPYRMLSRSSNDTVMIEGDNGDKCPGNSDNNKIAKSSSTYTSECINIDDSSDNSITDMKPFKSPVQSDPKIAVKMIESIISLCRNKYKKKIEDQKNNSESKGPPNIDTQLIHKFLSVGRKIINRDVKFNHNGLLRYIEHKNLNVEWIPKSENEAGKDYIRIMTKLKGNRIDTFDDSGWTDLPDKKLLQNPIIVTSVYATNELDNNVTNDTVNSNEPSTSAMVTITPVANGDRPVTTTVNESTLVSITNVDHDSGSKKLLNENPVANPKQLPKKINQSELKSSNIVARNSENNSDTCLLPRKPEPDQSTLVMPIITSTTSLVSKTNEENIDIAPALPETSITKVGTENRQSWIKVKPASELMKPENMLHNNAKQNHMWNVNNLNSVNMYISNVFIPPVQNVQSIKHVSNQNIMPVDKVTSDSTAKEYIILNNMQMPNTRTNSPLQYLQKLLMLHNITLLEPGIPTVDFVCLLKFKVQFKQENKNKPVTLCLSLYCNKNTFRIAIQDSNKVSIDMNRISANWQWEIMKIFQGDVSLKILQNAQKAGFDVYSKTKSFVYILKSITCVQEK